MNERELFLQAMEKPPHERGDFVARACGEDVGLHDRVASLLKAEVDAGDFLQNPPVGLALTIRSDEPEVFQRSLSDLSLEFLSPSDKPGCLGMIGHYEVVGLVGRGGFGLVLRAYDSRLNRIVAIKVLAPHLATNPVAVKRFLREAQAAAAVRHDHVVTIHAIEDGASPPFIVMEFVDGVSLKEKVDAEGVLTLAEILRVGQQIAVGLAAAHAKGLVHRDIKPANILLENGIERVKITDFGLARAADDISMTQTGLIAGTPQFMSPEQAQGQPIDSRSDLFSLGAVMYTLCTGSPPFEADSALATLRKVCDEPPRDITKTNAAIPVWLSKIVIRLLAKSPADRFESADEVGALFQQCLAHVQERADSADDTAGDAVPIAVSRMIPRASSGGFNERSGRPGDSYEDNPDAIARLGHWIATPTKMAAETSVQVWWTALLCFHIAAVVMSTFAAYTDIESICGSGPVFGIGVGGLLAVIAWRRRFGAQCVLYGISSVVFVFIVVTIINLFNLTPRQPGGMLTVITVYATLSVFGGVWLLGCIYTNRLEYAATSTDARNSSSSGRAIGVVFSSAVSVFRDQRVYALLGLIVVVVIALGAAGTGLDFQMLPKMFLIVGLGCGGLLTVFSIGSGTNAISRFFSIALLAAFLLLSVITFSVPGPLHLIDPQTQRFFQVATVVTGWMLVPIGLYGFARELGLVSSGRRPFQIGLRSALLGTAMVALSFAAAKCCMMFGAISFAGAVLFAFTLFCAAMMLVHLFEKDTAVSVARRFVIATGALLILAPLWLLVYGYEQSSRWATIVVRTDRPVSVGVRDLQRGGIRWVDKIRRDKELLFHGDIGTYELEAVDPPGLIVTPSTVTLERMQQTEVKVVPAETLGSP